jgi:hypothetical protein
LAFFMRDSDIEKVAQHLRAALTLLKRSGPNDRRQEWFSGTGHLSALGVAHLNSLFASGISTYAAAKEMGLSYRSTALRRKRSRREAVF